ncbi:MSCRAMM family protein [Enhygromyxa salina]|uniref:Nickel uptake substrate-specific transmembrane region n=1 Tax=Enhygromyxa salina TaxID=215803 RepID=A0A2S9YNN3_9BACT|nr:carboxypeptidase-like regulatory domain-containing protein [Enhygromyxa salina]PRQ06700.1 Nickel uptake substrate-specific transmembrane region [Enhygromyxa salina]
MPTPTTPPPTPSSKLWLFIGAALLAISALWFAFGRDAGTNVSSPEPSATAGERGSGVEPTPSKIDADQRASTSAAGQVRSTNGEAIPDALVTLVSLDADQDSSAEPHTTRTDDEGSWSLTHIPAGRYALSATAPGFLAGVVPELTLRPAAEHTGLDLRLEPGGNSLSGVVADKTGGVIEGALVQVTPQSGILHMRERDSYFTVTDEQGRYLVQLPDGRHRVRASHPDYSSESVVLELARQALTHDFALVPTAVIEGVVLRESDGRPVPGAMVEWAKQRAIVLPDGGQVSVRERGGELFADANGRFRISGLPPGLIELSGRATSLASESPIQIPVGIAERVEGIELMLTAAQDLSGRVVASGDGQAIAGARVELMSQLNPGLSALTDASGQFTIQGVLPGSYRALASAEGWTTPDGPPTMIDIGERANSVVLELERGLSIRGRVEPATHAEVAIELRPENMRMGGGMMMLAAAGSTHAAADTGAFELGPVEPGHYTLDARTPDGRGGSVEVEVGPDGARDVVIALTQRAILSGHVEDYAGKLVSDVSVRARKRQGASSLSVNVNGRELTAASSPTSTEGRFEIAGLAAGAWSIEVVDARGDLLPMQTGDRLELELADAQTKELVLRIEPRDGTITGTVRDAEGQPVADAWVSAAFIPNEQPQPDEDGEPEQRSEMRMIVASNDGSTISTLPPVLSDQAGRFEFTQLRRGDYTLTAELDGGVSKATLERVRPDANVRLDLAPLGALTGKVLSDDRPATCMLRVIGPSERVVRVRDGSFEIERLEPGRYTVEASAEDGATSVSVEIKPGETEDLELALARIAKVTGTIVDEHGAPIANAEILIGTGDGGRVEISRDDSDPVIVTKADGSFEARAAAGARVLIAQAPGVPMPIVIKPFVVEGGQDVELGELREQAMAGMMQAEPE